MTGGNGVVSGRLRLERIEAAARAIDPVFLNSPQFVCEPLSAAVGAELLLKVETVNPIRSFKGRGASWLVANLPGPEPLICASAGNFGQAMAFACRARGVPLTVYAATTANPMKIERMRALGATVELGGADFDAAKARARENASRLGVRFVEDSVDPEPTEGAGTIGLELARLAQPLDTLIVPLGNGALLAGIATAMRALAPQTRLVAVQSTGAPAMTESMLSGRLIAHDRIDTIADGIGVRLPAPEALADLAGLVDAFLLVPDAQSLVAMRLLHQHAGIVVEPSGAIGVGSLLERAARFAGERVGVVITGGNLTPEQMRDWLAA